MLDGPSSRREKLLEWRRRKQAGISDTENQAKTPGKASVASAKTVQTAPPQMRHVPRTQATTDKPDDSRSIIQRARDRVEGQGNRLGKGTTPPSSGNRQKTTVRRRSVLGEKNTGDAGKPSSPAYRRGTAAWKSKRTSTSGGDPGISLVRGRGADNNNSNNNSNSNINSNRQRSKSLGRQKVHIPELKIGRIAGNGTGSGNNSARSNGSDSWLDSYFRGEDDVESDPGNDSEDRFDDFLGGDDGEEEHVSDFEAGQQRLKTPVSAGQGAKTIDRINSNNNGNTNKSNFGSFAPFSLHMAKPVTTAGLVIDAEPARETAARDAVASVFAHCDSPSPNDITASDNGDALSPDVFMTPAATPPAAGFTGFFGGKVLSRTRGAKQGAGPTPSTLASSSSTSASATTTPAAKSAPVRETETETASTQTTNDTENDMTGEQVEEIKSALAEVTADRDALTQRLKDAERDLSEARAEIEREKSTATSANDVIQSLRESLSAAETARKEAVAREKEAIDNAESLRIEAESDREAALSLLEERESLEEKCAQWEQWSREIEEVMEEVGEGLSGDESDPLPERLANLLAHVAEVADSAAQEHDSASAHADELDALRFANEILLQQVAEHRRASEAMQRSHEEQMDDQAARLEDGLYRLDCARAKLSEVEAERDEYRERLAREESHWKQMLEETVRSVQAKTVTALERSMAKLSHLSAENERLRALVGSAADDIDTCNAASDDGADNDNNDFSNNSSENNEDNSDCDDDMDVVVADNCEEEEEEEEQGENDCGIGEIVSDDGSGEDVADGEIDFDDPQVFGDAAAFMRDLEMQEKDFGQVADGEADDTDIDLLLAAEEAAASSTAPLDEA